MEILIRTFFAFSFAFFMYEIIQPGMILGFYGAWVEKVEEKNSFLAKPLGACILCYGFWMMLISQIIYEIVDEKFITFVLPILIGFFLLKKTK